MLKSHKATLGKLKGDVGNQNYEIPEDTDISEYNSVVIWCEVFSVLFSPPACRVFRLGRVLSSISPGRQEFSPLTVILPDPGCLHMAVSCLSFR